MEVLDARATNVREFTVLRTLRRPDLAQALRLQQAVLPTVAPGHMRLRGPDELAGYLDGSAGLGFGVIERDTLVAMTLLRVPSARRPSAGAPYPRVPPADWPLDTAMVEGVLVHPAARGRGHQRALVGRCRDAAAAISMRWLCAAVHAANDISLRNMLRVGFAVTGVRQITPGPMLALLMSAAGVPLATDPDDQMQCALDDVDALQACFAQGYTGLALAGERLTCAQLVLSASPAIRPPRLARAG
jgi:GNAT superfamily N-acetyltransferase